MTQHRLTPLLLAAALPLAALPATSLAAGAEDHSHHTMPMPASHGHMSAAEHEAMFGQPGDPKKVTRTVEVLLSDDMRFTPASIDVKAGDTIRFFVRNNGQTDHEMVLGKMVDLKAHAKEMQANPGMVHKEPNQLHLKPSQRGALVWQFTQAGSVDFACTVPGHLEAGMVGKVNVAP